MISLQGKTALITGASRGIGRATAQLFAQAGARVAVHYHRAAEQARSLLETLTPVASGHLLVQGDVSQAEDVSRIFKETTAVFGSLDILVANAGIWEGRAIEELTEAEWDRTIAVNLKSIYLCCHHAVRIMKPQGQGNLITVSSTAGQRGEAFHSDYAASKGAIISFTKSLASELGPSNIRVNCVAPGWVDTEMTTGALQGDPAELKAILSLIPLGRVASPEEIAGPILFLASDLARHIQGEVLNVNGGSILCG
jgi:3-oxoacyl-[acyl-carrier protein] reductase